MFSVIVLACFNILVYSVCSVCGLDVAMIDVVLVENNAGRYSTLTYHVKGRFSKAGAVTSAEGDIFKLHGLNLCTKNVQQKTDHEYGWVGVMKIPPVGSKSEPCVSVVKKAEIAVQHGATAVIFDVTDNPKARKELEAKSGVVLRPVVIVEGADAKRLETLLHERKLPRARIKNEVKSVAQATSNEYFDMGIFMAFFILVSLICLMLLIKIKWRQKRKQTSLTRMALQAISHMETRKYTNDVSRRNSSGVSSHQSFDSLYSFGRWPCYDIKSCAICLEEFTEGQDIRIVPCRHEFHKSCVDPWLLTNCTCPLCMLNIVEPFDKKKNSHLHQNGYRLGIIRHCVPAPCLRLSADLDEAHADELQTNIEIASSANYTESNFTYHPQSRIDRQNLSTEQSLLESRPAAIEVTGTESNRDCLQPYRFPRCKFHHKRNRHRTSEPVERVANSIDHSIVVVADVPVENFEKISEDIV